MMTVEFRGSVLHKGPTQKSARFFYFTSYINKPTSNVSPEASVTLLSN